LKDSFGTSDSIADGVSRWLDPRWIIVQRIHDAVFLAIVCLLGTHVGSRAEDHPRLRHRGRRDRRCLRYVGRYHAGRLHRLREAEVQYLYYPIGAHFDVGRLEITIDDALLVRRFERLDDLLGDRECLIEWNGSARDALSEIRWSN
jgi:hypothetical protein